MGANGRHNGVVADADGHIMEPGNLWKENLEPRYQDRAMQVVSGEDGLDYLEIDGRGPRSLTEPWEGWEPWTKGGLEIERA